MTKGITSPFWLVMRILSEVSYLRHIYVCWMWKTCLNYAILFGKLPCLASFPIFWSSRDPRKPMEQKIERETMRKMDLQVDLSKTEPYRALRAWGGYGKRESLDNNYEDRSTCKDIQIKTILFYILCLRKWNMVWLITPFIFLIGLLGCFYTCRLTCLP